MINVHVSVGEVISIGSFKKEEEVSTIY